MRRVGFFALLLCGGCGGGTSAPPPDPPPPPPALPTVVFLGDSLTAGYGLDPEFSFPSQLGRRLEAEGIRVRIVNAGVSGDTSAGGLGRVEWTLRTSPDLVVVELGVNDGMRGVDPAVTEENLRQIIARVRASGARVALLGMRIPTSMGIPHGARFEAVYRKVAEDLDVPLLPFLLAGVAGRQELNQGDGIHPNRAGYEIVTAQVHEFLGAELARLAPRTPSP